jgi:hypothetical protein
VGALHVTVLEVLLFARKVVEDVVAAVVALYLEDPLLRVVIAQAASRLDRMV